jgi:hypothetical protein
LRGALPLVGDSIDDAVAAFVLNHLTDLPDLCSIVRCQTKDQRVLGVLVALVLVVIYDVVHHGRSPADLEYDHVAIDGLDYVGRLVADGVADVLDRDAPLT